MRESKRCPKCDSRRVAHLPLQPDDAGGEAPRIRMIHAGTGTRIGPLEAYVCADCGYYESYVRAPDRVDWDSIPELEWLNLEPRDDGPYR